MEKKISLEERIIEWVPLVAGATIGTLSYLIFRGMEPSQGGKIVDISKNAVLIASAIGVWNYLQCKLLIGIGTYEPKLSKKELRKEIARDKFRTHPKYPQYR